MIVGFTSNLSGIKHRQFEIIALQLRTPYSFHIAPQGHTILKQIIIVIDIQTISGYAASKYY